jgi:hypothetical protein
MFRKMTDKDLSFFKVSEEILRDSGTALTGRILRLSEKKVGH